MRQRICLLCGRKVKTNGLIASGFCFHLGCYLREVKCPHCGNKVYRGKVYVLQRCPDCGGKFTINDTTLKQEVCYG